MKKLDDKDLINDKKDEYIRGLIGDFKNHVELCNTNFMKFGDHFAKVSGKQTRAVERLIREVEKLNN
jgi:hypothetical protein